MINQKKQKLGIIAGHGELPVNISNTYNNDVYIAQISDTNDDSKYNTHCTRQKFHIGEVGKILEYFRSNDVKHIVMAGGIKRPNFKDLKVDSLGKSLVYRIIKSKILGDDKLLRIVADFLEEQGFKIISAQDIIKDSTLPHGLATSLTPDDQALLDIELGKIEAQKLGLADIGQSVIIEHSTILGLEDNEGTDVLIHNCTEHKKHQKSGVLVKIMKPQQDERLDIPTIGPITVTNVYNAGLAGIAIEANKVIVLDVQETINTANKLGIFIIGI